MRFSSACNSASRGDACSDLFSSTSIDYPRYALSHTRVYLLMLLSSCGGFMWLPRMV